jgi:hypothetical protein
MGVLYRKENEDIGEETGAKTDQPGPEREQRVKG